MVHIFFSETCIVEGHTLHEYPGATRKAYSTFSKAMLECSKGTLSIYYHVGRPKVLEERIMSMFKS